MSYPRWRYHQEKEARIVYSAEQDAALGQGWVDSPADFKPIEAPAPIGAAVPATESHIELTKKRARRGAKA